VNGHKEWSYDVQPLAGNPAIQKPDKQYPTVVSVKIFNTGDGFRS